MGVCCCHLRDNKEEKKALLRMRLTSTPREHQEPCSESSDSSSEEESLFGPPAPDPKQMGHRQNHSRTASPNRLGDATMMGSDRELQAFISMRDQADEATEEWEKLNYDIHTLRYARREIRTRWKKILLQLGYQCEVDHLLCMNRQNRFSSDQERLKEATELLNQLLDRTSLFPPGTEHDRYLHVMDRLVSLDSAEDFIQLAKEKYPKNEG